MSTVYALLAEVFGREEEPPAAARAALEVIREPGEEVLQAGIAAAQWTAAVDAMLLAADAADMAEYLAAAEKRKEQWPFVRRRLTELECQLWQSEGNGSRWRIEGLSVDVEIDLHTGELTGLDGDLIMSEPVVVANGFYQVEWTLDEMVAAIARRIRNKRQAEVDKARRAKMRKDHDWISGKGWVPKRNLRPA
jgi:hypothetical protein